MGKDDKVSVMKPPRKELHISACMESCPVSIQIQERTLMKGTRVSAAAEYAQ